jgi:hypothetical protein
LASGWLLGWRTADLALSGLGIAGNGRSVDVGAGSQGTFWMLTCFPFVHRMM